MSVRRSALMAGLLLCGGARADEDSLGGFVLASQEATRLQATPLNVDNFLAIPERKTTLAGLLEGRFHDVTWRARFETWRSDIDGRHSGSSGTLQELNRVFQLTPVVTLSLGKRLYALDPSFVNQPLGFLQKRTDLSDPLDELGQSEGLPMAVLGWTGSQASLTAIYSKDAARHADGYNRGVEQSIVKLGYEFEQLSVSMLLRRASGEPSGIGATLSGATGEHLSWYGSAYSARNTRRATAGLTYTLRDLPKLQLEYAYDGRGMSDGEYAGWLALIDRNQSLPLPDIARKGLQAQAAQVLTSQGARQRYVSVTLAQTVGDWELGGGVYAGRDDHSAVWHGTADYRYSPRTTLMLSVLRQTGDTRSERGLSPLGSRLAFRVRRLF
ncbi:porin [Duganella sp. HH101]|uniref:porin n=1 Tax=Duganella sp. HH101 TaxID=1781066 RepID=UPI0008932288|nr:porin [Duganella sp. HH101]OEZ98536.1 hypothetical protein DUGA2_55820 [Duganella sp. HH101]